MKTWDVKKLIGALAVLPMFGACTGQIPDSFRFLQQNEKFDSITQVNTKVDLLWVVDNSASMDVSQQKLRNGFAAFATKYMKPTWDIRLAVITTDTYLANSSFTTYLNKKITGSTGYVSPYISSRLGSWVNPSWNPTLVNTTTGAFTNGVKYNELVPLWRPNFSRLLAGYHDGPTTAICVEFMPYFLDGVTDCAVRDNQLAYNGPSHCVNPTGGESSLSQCVNTIENDTVRSGKAIIKTKPPTGVPADNAWTQQLLDDFTVNLTTGSAGHGSERGISSVLQMITDNESTVTSFFRAGSIRGIVFVSDEEDQSMTIPASPPASFTTETGYACDQAGLIAMNPTANITGVNGLCCANPANNCKYGNAGTTCPSKTVDGHTYTISVCPAAAQLISISSVKSQLDAFFLNLDGATATDANYFIASIVPTTGAAIQNMQTARTAMDISVGAPQTIAIDRGDRYIALGNAVGNGSLSLNMDDNDYSAVLDAVGQAIVAKSGTFHLNFTPTGQDDMIITVIHANGSFTQVQNSDYSIVGNTIVLDLDFVLTLVDGDSIAINYQPQNGE